MADDAALLEAWRDGDDRSGRELFSRHFGVVCRFFRSKVDTEADDLVQQTFLRCVAHCERLRDSTGFRAYLLATARSVMVDHLRKRARSPQLDPARTSVSDGSPSPSTLTARKREYRLLLGALRRLPLDTQILLELSFWEQMSSREIGEVLGVPAPTIRSRITKARSELRRTVEELASSPNEARSTLTSLERWATEVRDHLG